MLRSREAVLSKIDAESEPFSVVDINSTQGVQRYKVLATIEHRGDTLQHGHYVSYVLTETNWYECNDSNITKLTKESFKPTKNAYIILLKKVTE